MAEVLWGTGTRRLGGLVRWRGKLVGGWGIGWMGLKGRQFWGVVRVMGLGGNLGGGRQALRLSMNWGGWFYWGVTVGVPL